MVVPPVREAVAVARLTERERPLISVIIPTLNEQVCVRDTLLGFQSERKTKKLEIIIADGGSSDDTRQMAEGLYDTWVDAPKGRARQMNAGAQNANSHLLWFIHADTRVPESAIHYLYAVANTQAWGRFDVSLSGRMAMFRVIEYMINWRSRTFGIATGDQGLFISQALYQQIGGFPDQPLMEDVEISKRLKRLQNPDCSRIRLNTSSRRWEQHGIWRTIFLMWRLRYQYYRGVSSEQLFRAYYK